MKVRRFVGWQNLKMFAVLPREWDVFYQAVQDVWVKWESSRAFGSLTLAVFAYITDMAQSGNKLEVELVQKVDEVEHYVLSLVAF